MPGCAISTRSGTTRLIPTTAATIFASQRRRPISSRQEPVRPERSLPDATHGNCHLLLPLGLTIERLTAFAEVIERCRDRIVFGYRPVKSVCLQPVVLSINGAIATQHGIEA